MPTLVNPEIKYSAGIAFHVCRSFAKRLNRRVGLEEPWESRENSVSRRLIFGLKTSMRRCPVRRLDSTAFS
jgi:hypothetical protein